MGIMGEEGKREGRDRGNEGGKSRREEGRKCVGGKKGWREDLGRQGVILEAAGSNPLLPHSPSTPLFTFLAPSPSEPVPSPCLPILGKAEHISQ